MPPGSGSRAHTVQLLHRFFVGFAELGIVRRLFEPFSRQGAQHFDRIVSRLAPQRVVEAPEDFTTRRIPTPPEVGSKLLKSLGQRRVQTHRHAAAPRAHPILPYTPRT